MTSYDVEDLGDGDFVLLDEGSNSVARVYDRGLAHQFAASPDLLAVASAVAAGGMSYPKHLRDKAAAAIAKAQGKEVAA